MINFAPTSEELKSLHPHALVGFAARCFERAVTASNRVNDPNLKPAMWAYTMARRVACSPIGYLVAEAHDAAQKAWAAHERLNARDGECAGLAATAAHAAFTAAKISLNPDEAAYNAGSAAGCASSIARSISEPESFEFGKWCRREFERLSTLPAGPMAPSVFELRPLQEPPSNEDGLSSDLFGGPPLPGFLEIDVNITRHGHMLERDYRRLCEAVRLAQATLKGRAKGRASAILVSPDMMGIVQFFIEHPAQCDVFLAQGRNYRPTSASIVDGDLSAVVGFEDVEWLSRPENLFISWLSKKDSWWRRALIRIIATAAGSSSGSGRKRR